MKRLTRRERWTEISGTWYTSTSNGSLLGVNGSPVQLSMQRYGSWVAVAVMY
jgi:hypothetical protein